MRAHLALGNYQPIGESNYWTSLAVIGESAESSRDPVGYWIRYISV